MALYKNLAYATIAVAPTPNTSGVTATVGSGQGANLNTGRAVVWAPGAASPSLANAEIINITTIAGDVLTLVRQSEPSSPTRGILVGDQIANVVTAGTLLDILPNASAPTTTGNITSLPLPGGNGPQVTRMNNATLATIQGMTAGLYIGQTWTIFSIGTGQVNLSHNDGAATGAKLSNFITGSVPTPLAPGTGVATFTYDGTKWVLTTHEQGAPLAWTPTIGGFSGQSGQVYSIQEGTYRVSGRVIHVQGRVVLSTLGTITGLVCIFGLPFTVEPTSNNYATLSIGSWGGMTNTFVWIGGYFIPNNTGCALTARPNAGTAVASLAQGDLGAASDFLFSGDYETS